jgi:hypothetical protein
MLYQYGGPFGDPAQPAVEEVAIGGVVLLVSFVDEPREKLEKQGIDVTALTQDVGGGLRRRWKVVDAAGHVSWGRSRTEALQKGLGRALGAKSP